MPRTSKANAKRLTREYDDERYVESPETCFFYHTMDLPEFGVRDGGWDLRGRFKDYIGNVDVAGKRVLDIGAASGFLSFESERAGAAEVTSFDLDTAERQHLLPFHDSEYMKDHAKWCREQTASFKAWQRSYWLAHRLYKSKARVCYGDVYNLPPYIGRHDIVLLGAILEHLIDPLSALKEAARVCDDTIIINTDYLDITMPVAAFNGRADRSTHSFCFWTYSIALYDEYMGIMGFQKIAEHKGRFAGTRAQPNELRPMMERVALVYKR